MISQTSRRLLGLVLSRRHFLRLTLGVAMIPANLVATRCDASATKSLSTTGYGSAGYGQGKYGTTADRFSAYLPISIR